MDSAPVRLHIYDISRGMAAKLSPVLLGRPVDGLWHTNVVVGDTELSYGPPLRRYPAGGGPMGAPDRVLDLGDTRVCGALLDDLLTGLARPGGRFSDEAYDILYNNCNHFANEMAAVLTGASLPDDILHQGQVWLDSPLLGELVTAWTSSSAAAAAAGSASAAGQWPGSGAPPGGCSRGGERAGASPQKGTTSGPAAAAAAFCWPFRAGPGAAGAAVGGDATTVPSAGARSGSGSGPGPSQPRQPATPGAGPGPSKPPAAPVSGCCVGPAPGPASTPGPAPDVEGVLRDLLQGAAWGDAGTSPWAAASMIRPLAELLREAAASLAASATTAATTATTAATTAAAAATTAAAAANSAGAPGARRTGPAAAPDGGNFSVNATCAAATPTAVAGACEAARSTVAGAVPAAAGPTAGSAGTRASARFTNPGRGCCFARRNPWGPGAGKGSAAATGPAAAAYACGPTGLPFFFRSRMSSGGLGPRFRVAGVPPCCWAPSQWWCGGSGDDCAATTTTCPDFEDIWAEKIQAAVAAASATAAAAAAADRPEVFCDAAAHGIEEALHAGAGAGGFGFGGFELGLGLGLGLGLAVMGPLAAAVPPPPSPAFCPFLPLYGPAAVYGMRGGGGGFPWPFSAGDFGAGGCRGQAEAEGRPTPAPPAAAAVRAAADAVNGSAVPAPRVARGAAAAPITGRQGSAEQLGGEATAVHPMVAATQKRPAPTDEGASAIPQSHLGLGGQQEGKPQPQQSGRRDSEASGGAAADWLQVDLPAVAAAAATDELTALRGVEAGSAAGVTAEAEVQGRVSQGGVAGGGVEDDDGVVEDVTGAAQDEE